MDGSTEGATAGVLLLTCHPLPQLPADNMVLYECNIVLLENKSDKTKLKNYYTCTKNPYNDEKYWTD